MSKALRSQAQYLKKQQYTGQHIGGQPSNDTVGKLEKHAQKMKDGVISTEQKRRATLTATHSRERTTIQTKFDREYEALQKKYKIKFDAIDYRFKTGIQESMEKEAQLIKSIDASLKIDTKLLENPSVAKHLKRPYTSNAKFSNIPPDALAEILSKLGNKNLKTFRQVSKTTKNAVNTRADYEAAKIVSSIKQKFDELAKMHVSRPARWLTVEEHIPSAGEKSNFRFMRHTDANNAIRYTININSIEALVLIKPRGQSILPHMEYWSIPVQRALYRISLEWGSGAYTLP
jgi:hypothetical protein